MTYQGARARPIEIENKRFFTVWQVALNELGLATHVLWSEINAKSNGDTGEPVVVPVADVVDAIHGGAHVAATLLPPHAHSPGYGFVVVQRKDGSETIDLLKPTHADKAVAMEMKNLAALDMKVQRLTRPPKKVRFRSTRTFAVSQVALDDDGRVTDVFWARVNTIKNAWAEPEWAAPVAAVVLALKAGDQVFALFPSIHGHLPDRQFTQANYDGARPTIVLVGPTAYERDIHDMDRMPFHKPVPQHAQRI